MDRKHAEALLERLRNLDPSIGSLYEIVDQIADPKEKSDFQKGIGDLLASQNELIRKIVRQFRDLEAD